VNLNDALKDRLRHRHFFEIYRSHFDNNCYSYFIFLVTGTIFHVYQAPVVVTLLVGTNANLGAVRSSAIPLLKETLEPLCATLLNSLAPAQTDSYPQQGYYQ
jgi:hypothetical protein